MLVGVWSFLALMGLVLMLPLSLEEARLGGKRAVGLSKASQCGRECFLVLRFGTMQ